MVHSFSSVSILPSLQFWRSWVLLSRSNVADIAGCVVFMGYDLRIVLGPMFHSAILLALDDMVDQRSGNVLTVPHLLGTFVVVSSCQRPSALSPQAWKTAPPVACGTNGGCLSLDCPVGVCPERNAVSLISSNLSASTLLMSTFQGHLSRRLNGCGTLRALHHKVAAIKRERHANQRRAIRV